MGRILLFLFIVFISLNLGAQRTMKESDQTASVQRYTPEQKEIRLSIYPVPVNNNTFTIRSDKEISLVKVTNIIGQDIFREKYNTPQQLVRITLNDPQRGMYLVTVIFSDELRIVKKIMIEGSK
ncbi:MAG TPA: T9SS type A sorting domain-containing protein [Bacteroidales bacterium]|nr:T9SS type A sorting domain-containing protein [Bacteroidales bacterium]